ncbi:hypothetical protein [Qipengyuania sp. JC766]|uniref:hypothetical protein n=1 Tax=Qipengyuania sp. JC766 TaxID=3232139 RepID=UPI003457DF85
MSAHTKPIGIFVHHQGRGHAERAAALANAMAADVPVRLFSAREDIFPALSGDIEIVSLPSLFEPDGVAPSALDDLETPDTLHCAPVGWQQITDAVATLTAWFARERPALFVTDVSAELGQLARIASVPHMAVLQHGERDDPGHMASYRGAAGLLAPYARALEQVGRPPWMTEKTIYAPGIGIDCSSLSSKAEARRKLALPEDRELVVVVSGGGGTGFPTAPLTIGARFDSRSEWVTLGRVESEWHETPPANLRHLGWVENPEDWISAADRVVSSAGNTTVHMVASAAKPWVVVPEWRYFAEQLCKAEALDRAGVAAVSRHWPASGAEWSRLWHAASCLDPEAQRALVKPDAAKNAAEEILCLTERLWKVRPPVAHETVKPELTVV